MRQVLQGNRKIPPKTWRTRLSPYRLLVLFLALTILLGVLVVQSCPTPCAPMNCSPPGSPMHGIHQARTLAWVAMPSSGDRPDPGMEPGSPALQAASLPSEPPGKPDWTVKWPKKEIVFWFGVHQAQLLVRMRLEGVREVFRWLSWKSQDSRCSRSSEPLATYLSLSEAFPHNPCCLPAPIDTWPWNVGEGRTRIGRGP